jgi:diguanylate cyclase (GGDEF)-like protein
MNKYTVRAYVGVFVVALALAIVMGTVFGNSYTNDRESWTVEKWELTPEQKDGDYYFTFSLPEKNVAGEYVAFQTAHFEVEVTIDGETVMSLKAGNSKFNKSTGYRWNLIRLSGEDAGKEMCIRMIPTYKGLTPRHVFYYGDEVNIDKEIIAANGPRFLLANVILLIGVILLIYAFFIVDRKKADPSLVHFSIFCILLAIWSIMESPVTSILGFWPVGGMVIDHYALMVMPMAFSMYIRRIFSDKDNVVWKVYTCINGIIITLRTLLQVTTLLDLKQTLWMTQLALVLFIIFGVVMGIRELRISKPTRELKINLVCVAFMFAATILELVLFQLYNKSSIWGMLGFVVYVVVMATEMVRKSRKMLERAQEAELYRKLAYTDELTGVYNRTAFRHDMDAQIETDSKTGKRHVKPNTVFMFDLNDLKTCNDTYGHENGDKYIRMISNAVTQVFGIDGRCYRIGGDEFCVLMPDTNQNEIDNKLISLLRDVQELDRKGFVVPVSVAVGYATYDPECDENLDDTMKRADVLMYQNKQMIKKKRSVSA